jgi:hypothetical protein
LLFNSFDFIFGPLLCLDFIIIDISTDQVIVLLNDDPCDDAASDEVEDLKKWEQSSTVSDGHFELPRVLRFLKWFQDWPSR